MGLERMGGKEKKQNNKTPLKFVLAAIGALQGAPAPAADPQLPPMETLMQYAKPNPSPLDKFFERTLTKTVIDTKTWLWMERQVMDEKVWLPAQIKFIRHAFRPNGPYIKAFESRDLSLQTLSIIMGIVDRISTRMNRTYEQYRTTQLSIPEFEYLFAYMTTLDNATRIFRSGTQFCNAFFYRDSRGDIRVNTAKHCMSEDLPPNSPFTIAKNADTAPVSIDFPFTIAEDADAATALVPPTKYAQFQLKEDDVPKLDPTLTPNKIAGQPVISYSWAPSGQLKVHFSIAMPITQPVRAILYAKDATHKDPYLTNEMMMLKPPEEGKVTQRDEQGNIINVGASGSSGSLVALPGTNALHVVGTLVSVREVQDACQQVCYTVANFNTPNTLETLAQHDRTKHPHK